MVCAERLTMKNAPAIVPLILIIISGSLSAQVDLKFKFSDGEKQALEYRSTAHQILTLAGMDIETKSYTSMGIDLQYGMRDKKGRQQVTQQASSLFTDLSLPGGIQVTFDSANPQLTHDIPQIQALMELWDARSRSEFVFMLDADNKAIEVTGSEALSSKLSPMAADIIRADIEPTRMLENFNRKHAILPDTSVKTGDLWTRKQVMALGSGQYLSIDVQYEYRFDTVRDGITLKNIGMSELSVDFIHDAPPSEPLRIVGSALEVEPLGGTILFDANRGVLVESSSKMRITGALSLTANGQPLSGKLDLTMESQVLPRK